MRESDRVVKHLDVTDRMLFLLRRMADGCTVERRASETGGVVVGLVGEHPREVQKVRMVTVYALFSRGLISRKDVPFRDYYSGARAIIYRITPAGRKAAWK